MSYWNVKNKTFVFTINKIKIQIINSPKRDGTPNHSLKRPESFTNGWQHRLPWCQETFFYLRVAVSVDKTGWKLEFCLYLYPFHKKWWPVTHTWWCMHQNDYFYLLFNCTTVYCTIGKIYRSIWFYGVNVLHYRIKGLGCVSQKHYKLKYIVEQGWATSVLECRCPALFSSNTEIKPHLPVALVILKTLISLFRCVLLGLELNSAGQRHSMTDVA